MNENIQYIVSKLNKNLNKNTNILLVDNIGANILKILKKYLIKNFPKWNIKQFYTNKICADQYTQRGIDWADYIFVLDSYQEMELNSLFTINKPVIVLGIPSEYEIFTESLNELLEWMYTVDKFKLPGQKPNVLIGTPIHDVKLYCWEEYSEAVKKLGYPVLLVDTSENKEMKPYIEEAGFI
jgi:predicted protein tyrosine phosphatase